MISPELGRKITSHLQENGKFLPFTYSIGLESSLTESLNSVQNYPLETPHTEEQIALFLKSLTFYHEAAHLCQYTGTAFGLRTLRFTNICLAKLSQQKNWRLPVITELRNKWYDGTLTTTEQKLLEGALNLLDVQDQLTLHHYNYQREDGLIENVDKPEYIAMTHAPWNPYFFFCDQDNESRMKYANMLRENRVHVRKLHSLVFYNRPEVHEVVINPALLMETFALLVEMNHVGNAIDASWEERYSLLPKDSRYYWLINFLVESKLCELSTIIPTLSVMIDASLMYDPFILYNTPWDAVDQEGRVDVYAGETFDRLCEGITKTKKLKKGGAKEIETFYKELCKNSGLPDPDWMVRTSFEKAEMIFTKNKELFDKTGQRPLLYNAFKAHYDVLNFRTKEGCGKFLWRLPTSEYIINLVEILFPCTSFYNLSSNQPDHFDPHKIDIATVHSLLAQILTEKTVQCPLKMGFPFYCHSAPLVPEKLCLFPQQSECLLDILEKQYALIPGD